MSNVQTVTIDPIRELAFTGIGKDYAAVGGITEYPCRLVCFTNNTDQDCFVSLDGVTDQLFIAQGSFKLFDLCTNRYNVGQYWTIQTGTQFYVKHVSTDPRMGAFYIECLWGENTNSFGP